MGSEQQADIDLRKPAPITSFFSSLQLRRLQNSGGAVHGPIAESHTGAFLFLDLVAYTQLGEQLGAKGVKGAEDLSEILHAYYSPILGSIRDHGGDVLFFAGDAVGVIWLAEADDIANAAVRAARCALNIQSLVPGIKSAWPKSLQFRASIGVGPVEEFEVGGVNSNWMQLVRGDAIDKAYRADAIAQGGAVVLSKSCGDHLHGSGARLTPISQDFVQLHALAAQAEPIEALPEPPLDSDHEASLSARLTEAAHRLLYYPSSAVAAEFRRITVVFADISGTDADRLHGAVEAAQKEVARYQGLVYQLLEDDKGTKLIIVFGLPGASNDDDHVRAVLLSKKLAEMHASLGISARLGVASGTAFCGPLGTLQRQQYSIIGSAVNLAARLMMLAEPGEIYCDSQTRKLAEADFDFKEAAWTTPKGFSEPVPLFRPGVRKDRSTGLGSAIEIVGRDSELAQIANKIDEVHQGGHSRLVLVQADAGLGKSALLHMVRSIVTDKGLRPVTGSADPFDSGTAYFAFRNIARVWCGIDADDTTEIAVEKLGAGLADAPDLRPLIPLLGAVLGLDIPETDITDMLRGQLRSENTQRVMMHFAVKSLEAAPSVLLIEDGHWMDGASWAFLDHLLDTVPSVVVLLSTRPLSVATSEANKVLDDARTHVIDLNPMTRADTEDVVRNQLGVSDVAADVLHLVHSRAEGNPLFVREIVKNLVETGDIQIRQSRVQLLKRQNDADMVPDTLDGVITSRIDRLEADAQITIKAAAVLGRSFDADLLREVHPLSIDAGYLAEQLGILQENGFLSPGEDGADYQFHHALARDAAYNLLSFAQRESLHQKTAEALEAKHDGNTERVNARLGYHFRMAGRKEKAAPYLGAAGQTALDAYAHSDAIELLTTALELDEEHRGTDIGVDLSRATWTRLIGEAYYNQDNQPSAAVWYQRSTREAGVAPQYPVASIFPTLFRAIFAPKSLNTPPAKNLTDQDRKRIQQGLASARELGAIYLWESNLNGFALNAVNLVRMARIVGLNGESGPANSTLAFMMSSAGLRKRSEDVALQSVEMASNFGKDTQFMSANTITGMVLTQNGSPERSLTFLASSDDASNELISGIWRHRTKYMLADSMTWLGSYAKAHDLFIRAGELSHSAEPHTVALAVSMAALTQLRMGRPEQAIALLEGPEGVPHASECGIPFAQIMSLGILAEARLALGQKDTALAAVEEAEASVTDRDDGTGYYSSIFSYSAILSVRLQTGEFGVGKMKGSKTALDDDMKRMRKLVRVAALGKPAYALWNGVFAAHQGQTAKAKRHLLTAIQTAKEMKLPFEQARARVELAKLSEGSDKDQHLQAAIHIFSTYDMPLELARARALL
ncbi:MAG: adenylate/guanylate cyclase domain-containing protein [Pseudomonadota bacterium]